MKTAKKRLVVGNWKMHIKSPERAVAFVKTLRQKIKKFSGVSVVLAPAFPIIPAVGKALVGSPIHLGAQTLSAYADEKHTGEVSAEMLKHAGVSFVIVGHSERRARSTSSWQGETDGEIRAMLKNAAGEGLIPILCVGEWERDTSGGHFGAIEAQLYGALGGRSVKAVAKRLVVAYEPVWAIGRSAGYAMKPEELEETVIFIRKTLAAILGRTAALRTAILYGGSVEPENAGELIRNSGAAGFLVGHASVEPDTFLPILRACAH